MEEKIYICPDADRCDHNCGHRHPHKHNIICEVECTARAMVDSKGICRLINRDWDE